MKHTVLILCTGNSCRSQMAEGIVRHDFGDMWDAESAGTRPSTVNPWAIRVMQEIGIDISTHRSKHVDEFVGRHFDLVLTVCGNAERDCPVWPGYTRRAHVPFDDPADAQGSEEEILPVYRRVRDEIRREFATLFGAS
ncbi:MAG: arsenate reductase ArsC [Ignavibacteriae bacterium]|nr:arsenate reductase ArsC [Ignavibacteriota bacterium]